MPTYLPTFRCSFYQMESTCLRAYLLSANLSQSDTLFRCYVMYPLSLILKWTLTENVFYTATRKICEFKYGF